VGVDVEPIAPIPDLPELDEPAFRTIVEFYERRRGVEHSMDCDRPGMLIRKQLIELLARHGEAEVHR
jgi:hypothetical protein